MAAAVLTSPRAGSTTVYFTYNASPGSELRSTNKSDHPVKGFQAIVLDTTMLGARGAS